MRIKAGMIGVMAVMLALTGAILGSWALSTDVNDVERTTYNELTEITPLFGSESAPKYTDYNPSSNYTGYYTDNSVIDGIKYFDGVDYTGSIRVNNNRIDVLNSVELDTTIALSTYTGTYPFPDPDTNVSYLETKDQPSKIHSSNCVTVSLSSYITAMNLDPAVNMIHIRSLATPTNEDLVSGSLTNLTWIAFSTTNSWVPGNAYRLVMCSNEWFIENGVSPGYQNEYNHTKYVRPAVSCTVDLITNIVTLYADKDCTESLGTFSLGDVIMTYGGSNTGANYFNLGTQAKISALSVDRLYMDPSQGVELL